MPKHQLNPNKWIDSYADYLFNYTITRVSDKITAEDLVQETFFSGLKSAPNFKGEASERTWLVSILKRKIIDHYRKINSNKGKAEVRINYKEGESEGDWLEERVADPFGNNTENNIENNELGLAIHNCLEKLPQKQADIFKKKTIQNFDTEAICNEYDISPSNLWVIIHRARTTLSGCLEDTWFK